MENEAKKALATAVAGGLSPAARSWVDQRMRRWGYSPGARNLGGLACTLPHKHGDGSGCVSVPVAGGVRHVAQFESWDDAARVLVATARRASASASSPEPELPLVGYTSVHPTGDEVGFLPLIPLIFGPLAARAAAKWAEAPSPEYEAAFRGLLADWESFEREGVPDKWPSQRLTYDTWIAFRDAWIAGEPDTTMLNPAIEDANRVRKALAEAQGKPVPEVRPNVNSDDATPAIKLATKVDEGATKAGEDLWDQLRAVPLKYKVAAAAVVTVAVSVPLLSAIGPALLALNGLRGGGTTVVRLEAPKAARSKR